MNKIVIDTLAVAMLVLAGFVFSAKADDVAPDKTPTPTPDAGVIHR